MMRNAGYFLFALLLVFGVILGFISFSNPTTWIYAILTFVIGLMALLVQMVINEESKFDREEDEYENA